MEQITLEQVLAAREARVLRQQRLSKTYAAPVLSFALNIAGPVKDSPLIRRAFFCGRDRLEAALSAANVPILASEQTLAPTGCEWQLAMHGDALALKRLCASVEDAEPIGRLFDIDVLTETGEKLDRADIGLPERGCLVCGAPGRGCASRRVHSVAELQATTRARIEAHVRAEDPRTVSDLVTQALLDEVNTTPKPGLVDRANTGSHRDMTVETFEKSAEALRPYWAACLQTGIETASLPAPQTFQRLRPLGMDAERDMYAATGGVNTHKGAIFLLGILCGAIGRLWTPEAPFAPIPLLCKESAEMTESILRDDFSRMQSAPAATAGEKLYRACGLLGARGEAMNGFLSVQSAALPLYRKALDAGLSSNDAAAIALLGLIARGADTNMAARGGIARARQAAKDAETLLSVAPFPAMAQIAALDSAFIRQNLSPGGCADLLAVTLFLHQLDGRRKRLS